LLLRSAEGKPPSTRFVLLKLSIYRPALSGARRSRSRDGAGRSRTGVPGSTGGLGTPRTSLLVGEREVGGGEGVRGRTPSPSDCASFFTSTPPCYRVTLPCNGSMPCSHGRRPVEPRGVRRAGRTPSPSGEPHFHVYATLLQGNLAVQGGHQGPRESLIFTSTPPCYRVTLPCNGWAHRAGALNSPGQLQGSLAVQQGGWATGPPRGRCPVAPEG